MNDELLAFLGLAKKAGKLCYGHDKVLELINLKKCALVMLTADYSLKQAEHIQSACEANKIKVFKLKYKMNDLLNIASSLSGVIALSDKNFSKKVESLIEQNDYYITDNNLSGGKIL